MTNYKAYDKIKTDTHRRCLWGVGYEYSSI